LPVTRSGYCWRLWCVVENPEGSHLQLPHTVGQACSATATVGPSLPHISSQEIRPCLRLWFSSPQTVVVWPRDVVVALVSRVQYQPARQTRLPVIAASLAERTAFDHCSRYVGIIVNTILSYIGGARTLPFVRPRLVCDDGSGMSALRVLPSMPRKAYTKSYTKTSKFRRLCASSRILPESMDIRDARSLYILEVHALPDLRLYDHTERSPL
jgi:hypothetical protein